MNTASGEKTLIQAIGLSKSFGRLKVVDNISLDIREGEIFAFLGPNGAGKTTTVKLLTGLLKPDSGQVIIDGIDIAEDMLSAKKVIGFVSDQPYAYPLLTGYEFLRLIGDIYCVNPQEQACKIPELLKMFELYDWASDLIESYSHGMKQKLVLAGVLLHKPKVIFLDEPLVGLDPKSARLVKEILTLLSKSGTTIFMCTHVLEIAERLASRVGIIQQGKLIALETTDKLKRDASIPGTLEDVFLNLTGGTEYGELLKYL